MDRSMSELDRQNAARVGTDGRQSTAVLRSVLWRHGHVKPIEKRGFRDLSVG
jgi:hypothetical protein